jgi:hypothetical protein
VTIAQVDEHRSGDPLRRRRNIVETRLQALLNKPKSVGFDGECPSVLIVIRQRSTSPGSGTAEIRRPVMM